MEEDSSGSAAHGADDSATESDCEAVAAELGRSQAKRFSPKPSKGKWLVCWQCERRCGLVGRAGHEAWVGL